MITNQKVVNDLKTGGRRRSIAVCQFLVRKSIVTLDYSFFRDRGSRDRRTERNVKARAKKVP